MNKKELLDKAIKLNYDSEIPLFKGLFIIQERTLHVSGYRLMNIIGHGEYDREIQDYKYYLISDCSDVINFRPQFKKYINGNFSDMRNINMDINRHGIIHIWTEHNKWLKCEWLNTSSCMLEFVDKEDD